MPSGHCERKRSNSGRRNALGSRASLGRYPRNDQRSRHKKTPHTAGLSTSELRSVQEMQRPGTIRRASGPTRELRGASQPSRRLRRIGFTGIGPVGSWICTATGPERDASRAIPPGPPGGAPRAGAGAPPRPRGGGGRRGDRDDRRPLIGRVAHDRLRQDREKSGRSTDPEDKARPLHHRDPHKELDRMFHQRGTLSTVPRLSRFFNGSVFALRLGRRAPPHPRYPQPLAVTQKTRVPN